MPVKLNKIIKDLNVGLSTVVDFLNRKGFEVESNPNVKVSDEQYDLLVKEFSKGKMTNKETTFTKPYVKEPYYKEKPKSQEIKEIKTIIPEDIKPHFTTKGKIELEEKKSSHFRSERYSHGGGERLFIVFS